MMGVLFSVTEPRLPGVPKLFSYYRLRHESIRSRQNREKSVPSVSWTTKIIEGHQEGQVNLETP